MGENNLILNQYNFNPRRNKDMEVFTYEKYRTARDILEIGYGIFELEKYVRQGKHAEVAINRFSKQNSKLLKNLFNELISLVLLEDISFLFKYDNRKLRTNTNNLNLSKNDTVVLFSGGIDSFSGIEWVKKTFVNPVGVFCAHSDQTRTIHLVHKIANEALRTLDVNILKVSVPAITKQGYSQLRGFLYILSAGAVMEIVSAENLIISECGPTMYQPRFGLFDYVTMTTHPIIVKTAFDVLKMLIARGIKFYLPFENMTKAEVISSIEDKSQIPNTHSCVTQRLGKHDGTCYGCVLRKIGTIVTGSEDVDYHKDPFLDPHANNDNLVSLLSFSQDFLIDYNCMPLFQIENIESYSKKDLFYRFALDNLAAIHILVDKGKKITNEVRNIYESTIKILGFKIFEKRIETIRSNNIQINSNPYYL